MQYDGSFWVWVETWNLGSLSGKEEACEELQKRMIDVCCLQEVRWRGQGARMLWMKRRRYKVYCYGKRDGVGGVGVIVKEELCEKVVEVRRVRNRVMTLVVFEEDVLRLICGYAPQSGRSLEENQSFYYELKCEWDMHSTADLVISWMICFGDFNGHIDRHIDGLDGVHGGYGVGQRNLEGRMLLKFSQEKELCVKYMGKERGKEEGDIQNGQK